MVIRSEKIDHIAGALNKLQSMNLAVEKTENNPHFRSKFANLEGHWEMLRKPMTELGLCIVQMPSTVLDRPALTTIIMHTSGQFIEATALLAVEANSPQKQVAAITYMRRAALSGATGTVAVEDDDGNLATGKAVTVIPSDPSKYVVTIGKKHKGKTLASIGPKEVDAYAAWLEGEAVSRGKPLDGEAKVFVDAANAYLGTLARAEQVYANEEQWESNFPTAHS